MGDKVINRDGPSGRRYHDERGHVESSEEPYSNAEGRK